MTTQEAYADMIKNITTGGKRTTVCLAAMTIINLYGLDMLNDLEDAHLIKYGGQNSNNMAVYVIA